MKLQKLTGKLTTVFATIVLVFGICPLLAYADGGMTAGTSQEQLGAGDAASAEGGNGGAAALTTGLVVQGTGTDGETDLPAGESFICESTDGDIAITYYCTVISTAGSGTARAALTSVDVEPSGSLVDFAIPATITSSKYLRKEASGTSTWVDYQREYTIASIGEDGGRFSFPSSVKTLSIPSTVYELQRIDGASSLESLTIDANAEIDEIPDDFLSYAGASNLRTVQLSNSVERIGKKAFFNCYQLTNVNMPENLKAIDDKAFYNTALSSLDMPSKLGTIGYGAFMWDAGGYCYINNEFTQIPGPTFTSITIPASVTSVGDYAFNGVRLTSLAFAQNSNLVHIGDYAFAGVQITSLVLPASLRTLGTDEDGCSHAFYGCTALESVAFLESDVNPSRLQVVGGFGNCTALERFYMPLTSVTEIGPEAFQQCTALTTLRYTGNTEQQGFSLPASVELIGESAFSGCNALTTLALPGTVFTIGERAFSDCDSLTTLTLGRGTEIVGDYAFTACGSLSTVTLPKGLKTISEGAFSKCPSLKAIEIPSSVSLIGKAAFSPFLNSWDTSSAEFSNHEQGLTSITIKPGYTDLVIESAAFWGCKGLSGSTIVLPERVSKIGGGAFLYSGRGTTFEIHNPSIAFTSGEGYISSYLSEDDARVFGDVEPDEDGLCYVQVPDPWVTDDYANYKNQQTLSGLVTTPAVVKYPNTLDKGTSPSASIYFEQLTLHPDNYRPMIQAVDPSTFQAEEMDPDEGILDVAEAGRLHVKTAGPAGSNANVCVYDEGGNLVASGQAGRGLALIEGLAPGTYTVTAFAWNAGFRSVDSLDSYEALGLSPGDYAKETGVVIQEGKDKEIGALEVPNITVTASASDFIRSSSVALSKKDVFKNAQFFATVNFKMKAGKTAKKLVLKAPAGISFTSASSTNKPDYEIVNRTIELDAKDASSGRIWVGMKATKTGAFTVNASLVCDDGSGAGVAFPIGSTTVVCNAISLELPEAAVPAKVKTETTTNGLGEVESVETLEVDPFEVDVYAAPSTEVTLQCAGVSQKVTTNRNGHVTATIDLDSLQTALSFATVVATVPDGDGEAYAQGTVQFAAEQRDPYTLKEFSFVHANKQYYIVKDGKPLSRSNYYTYVANGKEANKYWSFEALYITDSPLWVGGKASAVVQNVSCTLQVQMLDGSSRYEKMALIGSEEQRDGTYLNRFAATLYLDQAGDHVFATSLIPTAFGVSLYAPEAAEKKLTQPDIDDMRVRMFELLSAWHGQLDVQRNAKAAENPDVAGYFADNSFIGDPDLLNLEYSEILFIKRSRLWEVYQQACTDTTILDSADDREALASFLEACDNAADLLGRLYDASIDADVPIAQCENYPDWIGKNTGYKSDQPWGESTPQQLEKSGWNVTTDSNAGNANANGVNGGTPTNGLTGGTFKEPKAFATKANKSKDGTIKSMSYRDSNGNSATIKVPNKYDVSNFDSKDFSDLVGTAFSWDNIKNGKIPRIDMKIESYLSGKYGAANVKKYYGEFNLTKYGFGFAVALQLGTTFVDGYDQWQSSKALVEAFKDADKARDYADNLTLRVNKMIKSGEWKKDPKCFKALKNERDWAIIVADGLKAHAKLSEVEGWRKFTMSGASGLAGCFYGPGGTIVCYGIDKVTGKLVANELNSNQGVLGPALRNLAAAHRQRMIDCGETEDDAPWSKPAILDPSGVVYEAFPDNALEGVTATVWEDTRAGNATEAVWTQWDAAEYDQVNPQTTGKDGAFSWDVPVGTWQVRFAKAGYDNAETKAMKVPPPRMGLKQAMVATAAPMVTSMTADTVSIEVAFDQYMDASLLPQVSVNGVEVGNAEWADVVEWVDAEQNIDKRFSKLMRVPVPAGTKLGDALSVHVDGVRNYADKPLAASANQNVTAAARPAMLKFNFDDAISMQAGTSRPATVRVYDGEGNPMQGVKLTASLDNGFFAKVDASGATTDADGAAKLQVEALLPGMSSLTVGVQGAELTRTISLLTTADANQAVRPVAKLGSTTYGPGAPAENTITVDAGTMLELTCSTEGATIFYTTDGSCPCQNTPGRKTYSGPITVNENTNFIIASYKSGMDYSEKLKLHVTVKKGETPTPGPTPDPTPDPAPSPTPEPTPVPTALKASTIALAPQTSTYTGKPIAYKGKITRTGSTGKVSFAYYKDAKCTKKVAASLVKAAGTYYVCATVAANASYKAATSKAVKLVIKKAANPMKASGKSPSVNLSKLKKKAVTIKKANAFKITKAQGKVTFKKAKGNKKIKVSKAGKVTVGKGLKKGTYKVKVKVTAAGNANYNKITKTVTVKVKVTKQRKTV